MPHAQSFLMFFKQLKRINNEGIFCSGEFIRRLSSDENKCVWCINLPPQNITKKNIDTKGVAQLKNIEKEKLETKEKSTKKPETSKSKPKQTPQKTVIAEPQPMRLVRVTVDVPEDLHEKLKIKMILSKQTIKDYLLNFIEKDLAKTDFKF